MEGGIGGIKCDGGGTETIDCIELTSPKLLGTTTAFSLASSLTSIGAGSRLPTLLSCIELDEYVDDSCGSVDGMHGAADDAGGRGGGWTDVG